MAAGAPLLVMSGCFIVWALSPLLFGCCRTTWAFGVRKDYVLRIIVYSFAGMVGGPQSAGGASMIDVGANKFAGR